MNNNLMCIFVSNDKYGDGINSLSGANRIIKEIYDFFVNSSFVNEENAILIQNTVHTDAINKIFEFMPNATTELQEEKTLLFYFCGHGFSVGKNLDKVMLATTDTNGVNYGSIGIKFDDVLNKANDLGIKRFIAILDCCSSGLANTMGINNISFNDKIENKNGTVIITSSKGSASTFEIKIDDSLIPGFSYYFYESVKSLSQDKTKFSLNDIFAFIQSKIVPATKGKVNPQITSQNFFSSENLFDFSNTTNKDVISMKNSIIDVIDWRITSNCDNSCGMCYACKDKIEMSQKEICTTIQKIKETDCKTICITGGEATLNNNFSDILNLLYDNEFSVFLSTNGRNYFDNIDLYNKTLEKLSLPLDGYDKDSNTVNGRNSDSFNNIIDILDDCKENSRNYKIKISTVLTSKNCTITHFKKMLELLTRYNIYMWKLYEFIPENNGMINRHTYKPKRASINRILTEINNVKDSVDFHIELVSRKDRDAAYFIIQPNGDVVLPIEEAKHDIVQEFIIGNVINDDINEIIRKWDKEVNANNYMANMKVRNIHKPYTLNIQEKNVLYSFISSRMLPSISSISNKLGLSLDEVDKTLEMLFETRIVKNIIPVINLNMFGIKTFLATFYFTKRSLLPEGYYIDFLRYNPHIGWITECDENRIRVAIFAKNYDYAQKIVEEINNRLSLEITNYVINIPTSEYSIGERNLFLNGRNKTISGADEVNNDITNSNIVLSQEEFEVLKQLESLRKPLIENIDSKILLKNTDSKKIIENLINKGVVDQLYAVLDTRMLGYKWYLIFVVGQDTEKADKIVDYLQDNYNNVTHINKYEVHDRNKPFMDFEIHVTSYAEVENIIENLSERFSHVEFNETLRIIKEHEFSFIPYYVRDEIYKNYVSDGD